MSRKRFIAETVDDGEDDSQIELAHSHGADRGELDGREIGFFGDTLQELAVSEMLGGNQAAVPFPGSLQRGEFRVSKCGYVAPAALA